jgi:hypothetical protein
MRRELLTNIAFTDIAYTNLLKRRRRTYKWGNTRFNKRRCI